MISTHMAKLSVLGGGRIGEALVAGLIASRWCEPGDITVTGRRPERLDELRAAHGVATSTDNAGAIRDASIVVLAVKPQDIVALLGSISGRVAPEQVVLSVMAAIPTLTIESGLGGSIPVVRAMPNAPSTVHQGMAGMAPGRYAGPPHLRLASEVLGAVGRVVEVPENYLDAVTAISGSGPAYFALLAEAMIEAGILLGLSREVSTQLVIQTMLGSATLLRDESMHPVELREMVTSPGGTTIRAIQVLEQSGVRAAFLNAIQAAMERSKELARGSPQS